MKEIDICEAGSVLKDGLCIEDVHLFRVDDPTFTRQSLQTGESLGDFTNLFGWSGLALSGFIVFAYVIMKIKKRKKYTILEIDVFADMKKMNMCGYKKVYQN